MNPNRRRVGLRWIFGVYAVLLFLGTHWPALVLPVAGPITRTDLVVHFTAFGVWTLLLAGCEFFGPFLSRRNILLSGILGIANGALDEALQAIPALKRVFDPADLAMNTGGALLALTMLSVFAASRPRTRSAPADRAARAD